MDSDLSDRAVRYAESRELVLRDQLGFDVHGNVFVAESQRHPGLSAVKIHRHESPFLRERDVYFRLREHEVSDVENAGSNEGVGSLFCGGRQ